MPQETPTYDLMLLLSTNVEDDRRAKILQDVETAIDGAKGSIVHNADWGTRPLAYRIDHQADAEYHLLQFTGPTSLLESLGHTLAITDGVLRHRIIKVIPGTPPPPSADRVTVPAAPPAPATEMAASASAADVAVADVPAPAADATTSSEPTEPAEPAEPAESPVEPEPSVEAVSGEQDDGDAESGE